MEIAGACDCHAHVFGPYERFPLMPGRSYTPKERLASGYRTALQRIGVTRGVIVQPSVFGTDNGATLNALAELGPDFRGVAVLPPDAADETLADFDARGIRGVRLSDLTTGGVPLAGLEAMAARLRGSRWHIQVFADFGKDPAIARRIAALGVPVVIDHMGLVDLSQGTAGPAFAAIVALLRDGVAWMKLSGPYLLSDEGPPWPSVDPVAAAFVEAVPERLVWASDWPHPSTGDSPPDIADTRAALDRWAPDPAVRARILRDNPATLYGFAS